MKLIRFIINWIFRLLPVKNDIVFESIPDLSDNTKAVYDEMIRQGLHHTYRMFWWVKGRSEDLPDLPNTKYLRRESLPEKIKFKWITARAKCLVCCNDFLVEATPNQKAFYLTHGTGIKKLNGGYGVPEEISYTLIAGECMKEVMAKELMADVNTFHALGYPRNDVLQSAHEDLSKLFGKKYDKVIVWYPTFRQHKNGAKTASSNALPILSDLEQAESLNNIARECNVLIVVKPHFAQDVSYIKDYSLSNIWFIDDAFFKHNNIDSYTFVGSCDALITDYSSIYFDYLLCDKPVAVVWEDIDEYRANPGFAIDLEYYLKGAHKIYTLKDFEEFLRNVSEEKDPGREDRRRISAQVNYSDDGKNAERVVAFIREKADL